MQDEEYLEVPSTFTGQSEAVVPETETAVVPPPIVAAPDINAIKAQAVREYQEELARQQASQAVQQAQPPVASANQEFLAQFVEDPHAMIMSIVDGRAAALVDQRMQQIQPWVQRSHASEVTDAIIQSVGVSDGLTREAQDYARRIASQIQPGMKLEGEALDIIKNATLYVDEKARAQSSRRTPERGVAEAVNVRVDTEAFRECNSGREKRGLKPLTAGEFYTLQGGPNGQLVK